MTVYPSAEDYADAVQHPQHAFAARSLQRATFPRPAGQGYLMPETGSNAVVFRARVEGREEALRFFTSEASATSRVRYDALAAVLSTHPGLTPHLPRVEWVEEGITVKGVTWPMLRMDWVEGEGLGDHVDGLVRRKDRVSLVALASRWHTLVSTMQSHGFAHGDLQHGNVIVERSGALRLIDFDGIWTPSLAGGVPPDEAGHACYQPPDTGALRWQRWMDTFPALVIHLSLLAVSREPSLWKFYTDNNLIFSKKDFVSPFSTEVWQRLARLRAAEIDRQAAFLLEACTPGRTVDVGLDDVLGTASWEWNEPPEGAIPRPRPANEARVGQDWREKVLVDGGPADPGPVQEHPEPAVDDGWWPTPPEATTGVAPDAAESVESDESDEPDAALAAERRAALRRQLLTITLITLCVIALFVLIGVTVAANGG